VHAYDLRTGKLLASHDQHMERVWAVAVSAEGFITAGLDHRLVSKQLCGGGHRREHIITHSRPTCLPSFVVQVARSFLPASERFAGPGWQHMPVVQ